MEGSWLAWRFGDGKLIHMGMNTFVGGEEIYELSQPLISHLAGFGYYRLAHIRILRDGISSYWVTTGDLGILGDLEVEWN